MQTGANCDIRTAASLLPMLHRNIAVIGLSYPEPGGADGDDSMGFQTELFSRPRTGEPQRCRAALETLNAMNKAERVEPAVRPADFPLIARRA